MYEIDGGRDLGRESLSTHYPLSEHIRSAQPADDQHVAWPGDGPPASLEELIARAG